MIDWLPIPDPKPIGVVLVWDEYWHAIMASWDGTRWVDKTIDAMTERELEPIAYARITVPRRPE